MPKIGRPPRLLYHDVLSLYQLHPSYDRSVSHLLQGFGTVCFCVCEGGSWNRTKEGQFGVMLKSGLYFILASIVKVMGVPVGLFSVGHHSYVGERESGRAALVLECESWK